MRLISTPLRFIAMMLLVTMSTSSCTSMRPIPVAGAPTAPKEYLDTQPGDVSAYDDALSGRF